MPFAPPLSQNLRDSRLTIAAANAGYSFGAPPESAALSRSSLAIARSGCLRVSGAVAPSACRWAGTLPRCVGSNGSVT